MASDLTPAQRFRLALDMHELGVGMRRQALRREHPGASVEEIERLVHEWMRTRPGAESGDAAGVPHQGNV